MGTLESFSVDIGDDYKSTIWYFVQHSHGGTHVLLKFKLKYDDTSCMEINLSWPYTKSMLQMYCNDSTGLLICFVTKCNPAKVSFAFAH